MSHMSEASLPKNVSGEKPEIASQMSATGGAIVLVAVLTTIYMISQFFRNSIGVIGPDLAREFDLDARALSLLASIFFLSFAAVQIPLGMAIDRFGARAAILATALVMIAGTAYFALARDFGDLVTARLVIGLGCSSFLMAPLALYAVRFPARQFATITGLHVGGGNFGALAATAPLALVAATMGWRTAFMIVGAIACVALALVFVLVRESAAARASRLERAESARELAQGVVAATRVEGFWRIFLMQLATYPAFAAILGLWSGPWLADVYGMSVEARGGILFAMVLAQIVGLFVWGASDRLFGSYKIPSLLGAGLSATLLAYGALGPLPQGAVLPFVIALGFAFGFSPVLTAHSKSLFPARLMGRGLSLTNIAAIGGVFLQQIATGALIALFPAQIVEGARAYPSEAYQLVFGFLALEIVVAGLIYSRIRDPHPSKEH
jgi:predicted MFS family arabinose efflux permease